MQLACKSLYLKANLSMLGAESCLTLLFICTQPKHGLASCLRWQKLKSFSFPKKPVSILCKSHKMLWSIVEAVISMYAGTRVWLSLHQGPRFCKKLCPYGFGCVTHIKGHSFLQPLFIFSWQTVVFPCHIIVVSQTDIGTGKIICAVDEARVDELSAPSLILVCCHHLFPW